LRTGASIFFVGGGFDRKPCLMVEQMELVVVDSDS
jgi:hypothetical protein